MSETAPDATPAAPPPSGWGPESLEWYIEWHLDGFTGDALAQAAAAAGHPPEAIATALERAEATRGACAATTGTPFRFLGQFIGGIPD